MKSYEQVASLIWQDPDTLDEQEIEGFLQVAEVQEALDRDNYMALASFGHYAEDAA